MIEISHFNIMALGRLFDGGSGTLPTYTTVQLQRSQIDELGPLLCKKRIHVRAIRQQDGWWRCSSLREGCERRGIKPLIMEVAVAEARHSLWARGYKNCARLDNPMQIMQWLKHGGRLCWLDIAGEHMASHGMWCVLEEDDDAAGD